MKKNQKLDDMLKLKIHMLPPKFGPRMKTMQRLYLILIVIFTALAIGVLTFVMMENVTDKYSIITNADKNYFLLVMILIVFSLIISMIFQFWSRSRRYIITTTNFINFLISPIIMIAGLLYISNLKTIPMLKLFFILGIINIAMVLIPILSVLFHNLLNRKAFKGALIRSLYITIPTIFVSSITFILWFYLKSITMLSRESSKPLIVIMSIFMVSIIIFIIMMGISSKYAIFVNKNIWKEIRFSGSLPTIIIYIVLLAVSIRFSLKSPMGLPLELILGLDALYFFLFIVFLYFSARIKNAFKTNPLFNQIILKIFVAIVIVSAIIMIQLMHLFYEYKSYGAISYAIMASSSLTIIIALIFAHFLNLITYSKHFNSEILRVIITLLIILGFVFTTAGLKFGNIIMLIMSKQLVIAFLSMAVIIETSLAFSNIIYVLFSFMPGLKKFKSLNKKTKKSDNQKIEEKTKQ